jgi:hypothetical protein
MLNKSEASQSLKKIAPTNPQSTGEIMFLKRLLFLKASLDNDTSTVQQPLSDKAFKTETASDDEPPLMITQAPEDSPMLQLMPPNDRFSRHPQTAVAKLRTRVTSERPKP